jgi:DNA-directed RNA polymerase subunit beta'
VRSHAKHQCAHEEYDQGRRHGEWHREDHALQTTAGRALLSEILPKGLPFSNINKAAEEEGNLAADQRLSASCGLKETVVFADKLMQNGFRLATRAGISIAIDDMLVPNEKHDLIERAERKSRRSSSSTPRVW